MLPLLMIIVLVAFIYFQQKTSDRNMRKFEKSREKYEDLLERLRKKDEAEKKPPENNSKNTQNES
jgi:hypothetical protein